MSFFNYFSHWCPFFVTLSRLHVFLLPLWTVYCLPVSLSAHFWTSSLVFLFFIFFVIYWLIAFFIFQLSKTLNLMILLIKHYRFFSLTLNIKTFISSLPTFNSFFFLRILFNNLLLFSSIWAFRFFFRILFLSSLFTFYIW